MLRKTIPLHCHCLHGHFAFLSLLLNAPRFPFRSIDSRVFPGAFLKWSATYPLCPIRQGSLDFWPICICLVSVTQIDLRSFIHLIAGVFRGMVFEAPCHVSMLGKAAFQSCERLQLMCVPSSIETIGKSCFECDARIRLLDFESWCAEYQLSAIPFIR